MTRLDKLLLWCILVALIILTMLLIGFLEVTASVNPIYIVHDVTEGDTPDFVMCWPSQNDCHNRVLARCDDPNSIAPPVGTPCSLLFGGRFSCGAEFQSPFYVSDYQHPYKSYLPEVGR